MRNLPRLVHVCLLLKRHGALDLALLAAAFCLFELNELVVKPSLGIGDCSYITSLAPTSGWMVLQSWGFPAIALEGNLPAAGAGSIDFDSLSCLFASLFKNHVNDFIGGIAFLAYTNVLLALVKPDKMIKSPLVTLAFIFCCGLFWECVAPLLVPGSIGDPLDLASYVLGGCAYWTTKHLAAKCHRDATAECKI